MVSQVFLVENLVILAAGAHLPEATTMSQPLWRCQAAARQQQASICAERDILTDVAGSSAAAIRVPSRVRAIVGKMNQE